LALVSDEIRSPVAVIVSAAKIIAAHHDARPDVALRFGQAIASEGERVIRLLNDCLELTSGCGAGGWNESDVDVPNLVGHVLEHAASRARRGGVQLIDAMEPGLPALRADSRRIQHVLASLVHNAIESTPAGGSISVRAQSLVDCVVLAVDDTGPGLRADEIPLAFERGGLGLCLAREIVRRYSGEMWVESSPGKGATFAFRLPIARSDAAIEPAVAA
jgi:signal transduction histidine kinase